MPNPFVHIELSTGDLAAARKFYKKIFDWNLSDMPMPGGTKYTMIDVGKGVGGGMQAKPMPEAPTGWLAYVEVDDVKKTLDKARKNGAQVVLEYQEVMGMGALGIFVDPTGAPLGVWQTFKKAPARRPAATKKAAAGKKTAAKTSAAPKRKVAAKRRSG